LKGIDREVPPNKLYTSPRIKRFMNSCKEKRVNWAIFSDIYGVWFPWVKHQWYEKDPDTVTEDEFNKLVDDFEEELQDYDEIWFYHNPRFFHSLYRRLLETVDLRQKLRQKVNRFHSIYEIE
jgi:hypothetical protein